MPEKEEKSRMAYSDDDLDSIETFSIEDLTEEELKSYEETE